jgi:hypothetical protein
MSKCDNSGALGAGGPARCRQQNPLAPASQAGTGHPPAVAVVGVHGGLVVVAEWV